MKRRETMNQLTRWTAIRARCASADELSMRFLGELPNDDFRFVISEYDQLLAEVERLSARNRELEQLAVAGRRRKPQMDCPQCVETHCGGYRSYAGHAARFS